MLNAWVTGFIGGKTSQLDNNLQIQSFTSQSNLVIYVQNTGQGIVHLKDDSSVYLNDILYNIIQYGDNQDIPASGLIPINPGQTVKITTDYMNYASGDRIKIVTIEGTTMQVSG